MASSFRTLLIGVILAGLSASAPGASTYTVTSSADTSAYGTLRWAIQSANNNPGSTIEINAGLQITLGSFLPLITAPVTINGNGSTISGNG